MNEQESLLINTKMLFRIIYCIYQNRLLCLSRRILFKLLSVYVIHLLPVLKIYVEGVVAIPVGTLSPLPAREPVTRAVSPRLVLGTKLHNALLYGDVKRNIGNVLLARAEVRHEHY